MNMAFDSENSEKRERHSEFRLDSNTMSSNNSRNCQKTDVQIHRPNKMNHKQWKAYVKKVKRKAKRKAAAQERDSMLEKEKEDKDSTDSEEERQREREEAERLYQNQLWLERERQAQIQFKLKKEWEEKERKRKEETEKRIREEWEERERKEREEQEEKEKHESEKRLKQDKLLREATVNENTGAWHNPIAPVQYGKEKAPEHCPFFKKTAACRFGDQCSRYHDYPESSCTLLIPGMFSSFELEQSIVDNMDTDVSLEYDDNDLYQSFKEFYEDVVPEFKTVGTVLQVKVCCNCEPHLRGNVYVQYKRESAAQAAFQKFNARWYGGRQLTCQFVNIESWKAAICGLAFKKRCPKGKSCNFLHVFCNPSREFSHMDHDRKLNDQVNRNRHSYREERRHISRQSVHSHRSHYRSRSRSPSQRSFKRSRSRSPSRRNSEYRSRPRSPDRRFKNRSRSRSSSHNRSSFYKRSQSRSASPPERRRKRSRSQSPSQNVISYAKSPSQKRGHRKSRSRSPLKSLNSRCRSLSNSPRDDKSQSISRSNSRSPSVGSQTSRSSFKLGRKRKNHKHSKSKHSKRREEKRSKGKSESESEEEFIYIEKTKDTVLYGKS